jgi:hypothetical protein
LGNGTEKGRGKRQRRRSEVGVEVRRDYFPTFLPILLSILLLFSTPIASLFRKVLNVFYVTDPTLTFCYKKRLRK